MQQLIKRFSWVGLLALGLQGAWAFSLGGPIGNNPNPSGGAGIQGDAWQVEIIGYGEPGDLNAPKNLGEEYRRNVPTNYYACDANFLDYFGSNGVAAVDGAFAILNGLTNVDSYSASLSEFPLETRHLNYQAQALGLFDLKSWTLGAMIEQLGLCDPVRYDWTLHDRVHIGTVACPADMEYLVVQRNFDPFAGSPIAGSQTVLSLYSPYVNNVLYSYYIEEICPAPGPVQAVTEPFSTDPLADTYSPVASFMTIGLTYGQFYTGLTRDDVGGLRYLLSANNINFENGPAGSILLNSSAVGGLNYGPPVLLYTSNYNAFWWSARTNDPVTLSNLFPGLVILASPYYFTNIATPIVIAYYTNLIGAPYGSPPVLVVKTNGYTYSYPAIYSDTFANLVITNGRPNTSASLVTVTVGVQTGAPYGSPLVTNTTSKTVTLANPSGEFYINTNYLCGPPVFVQTIGTNVAAMTNLLFATSNSAGYFTSQSLVIYSTTHVYVVEWPICLTAGPGGVNSGPGLREGIEMMRFVRADYDSLLGQFFQPITNTFTTVLITNSQAVKQTFLRVVTVPDFIFSAADIAAGPGNPTPPNPYVSSFDRNLNFDQSNVLPGLAGPGLITPSTTITFDKVGPVYFNYTGFMGGTPYFTETPGTDGSDFYYEFYFLWASFDGTTNDPVVYPNAVSIQNLENEILDPLLITPTNDVNYTVNPPGLTYAPNITFSVTGGAFVPPFTWSATGLPSGLIVTNSAAVLNGGTFSGTPTQSGTFDFTLIMTDSLSRSVQWTFSITTP
ncbi:MAG: hypothetical protein ACLPYZ_07965 [Limisphaerales bacterium]